jgi:hypothetical protein
LTGAKPGSAHCAMAASGAPAASAQVMQRPVRCTRLCWPAICNSCSARRTAQVWPQCTCQCYGACQAALIKDTRTITTALQTAGCLRPAARQALQKACLDTISGREYGHPSAGRQRGQHRAVLGSATACTLVHELQVLALRVVDQRHRRPHQMAARCAISPGWFIPSSTTRQACARAAHAQQRLRHADVIVQVALRGQCMAGRGQPHRMDGHHLGHGGLAVAAGDGHQRAASKRLAPARAASSPKGAAGICHQRRRANRIHASDSSADASHSAATAPCARGVGQQGVGVKLLAL